MILRFSRAAIAITTAILINACSGGSEGTGFSNINAIQGTISAPGGAIAFNEPGFLQRMFAGIFGNNAVAAINGVAPVGTGITVNLIEVDAYGNQVGDTIASATTNASGIYSIEIPDGFVAGSQYVVRAIGSTEQIDARVSGLAVDISPVTDAASELVTANADDLGRIDTTELQEFVTTVNDLSKDVDPTGLTAEPLSSALQTEALNNDESYNVINSASNTGVICGTVTNSSGTGLSGIRIVARDYSDWVTRSKTTTASDGSYCLNVPKTGDPDPDSGGSFSGEYILGAINRTSDTSDPDRSASEWWSAGGNAHNQFEGEKITVSDTNTVTRDFQLSDGARISGTVSDASTSGLIEGVRVLIRNFDSLAPVASARANDDGTYQVNLIPGTYLVEARNTTLQAYASETYDGASGSNNRNRGIPVTLITGENRTIDFGLASGNMLSGIITDGIAGNAVTGRRVMVNLSSGGSSVRLRTNKQGEYRVWLRPATYYVFAYGQKNLNVNMLASNQVVNFQSPDVSTIAATVLHNSQPVPQAKVRLTTSAGTFVNMEPSSSDGTVTLFTTLTGDHRIEARIDRGDVYGTIIYDNDTRQQSGQLINVASVSSSVDIGNINLPDGGILTGTVTFDGSTPIPNFIVEVRDDNNLLGTGGGVNDTDLFTRMRTRGDGTFIVSLPAGVYDRVKMVNASLSVINDDANCDAITIVAGETTTVNYNDATDTCF